MDDPTLAQQDEVAKRLLARAAELREQLAEEDDAGGMSEASEADSRESDEN